MADQIQTENEQSDALTGDKLRPGFPGRAHSRHRRGPVKRVLLVVGPFMFVVAALGLSAGIVEIVERPTATLAEERAMAARRPDATREVAPSTRLTSSVPSVWTPTSSAPGFDLPVECLEAIDYEVAIRMAQVRNARR